MFEVLAQSDSSGGGLAIVMVVIYVAVIVVSIAGMWKAFEKAGQPGWAAIVPIYNLWIWLKIVGREPWWIILFLIPCVNIVAAVIVALDTAKAFGKDAIFGILMVFFPVVGWPVIGFGSAEYRGPVASQGTVGM